MAATNDDLKLTPEAVKRLLAAPSKKRLINGWYNEVTRKAEFSRHSFELVVAVTHPRLHSFGERNAVELLCWRSCRGYHVAIPAELSDQVDQLVRQLKQEATMTDSEAENCASSLAMAVQNSYQEMGFTPPHREVESVSSEKMTNVSGLAHWLARDGANCQRHIDIAGILVAQAKRIEELERNVSAQSEDRPDKTDASVEIKRREGIADDMFGDYNFGSEMEVVSQQSWNTEQPDDLTKIVYVKFDDDQPDADSHKLSFHVRFEHGQVDDVYALDMETGNDVGCMNEVRLERQSERE